MHRLGVLVLLLLLLVIFFCGEVRADAQYLTCERDADCWSLQKQSRWCDEMVKCHKGRCTTIYHGPCNLDLETCDLTRRRCTAKYCTRDDNCPGGYCDTHRMRCAAGRRPETQTVKSTPSDGGSDVSNTPGDKPVSFTSPGAWTYYITVGGSLIFAAVGTSISFLCCIL